MASLVEQLKIEKEKLENKVNAMTVRERVILLVTSLVVLYFLWSSVVVDYLLGSVENIQTSSKSVQDQINSLGTQISALSQMIGHNPIPELNQKIKALEEDNNIVQDKIEKQTKLMISPKDMVQLFKSLLEQSSKMALLSMKNTGTTPLFTNTKDRTYPIQVYNHGIMLEVNSTYFDTLQFLQEAERETYKMIWDKLNYMVIEYPAAKVSISISTLGLEESLVGI